VLGIGNPQLFGGDYDGSPLSATMGGGGTNMIELTWKNAAGPAFHKVILAVLRRRVGKRRRWSVDHHRRKVTSAGTTDPAGFAR
jgi:hypothetical protein